MADDGPAFVVCAGLSAVVGRAATSTMAQLRFRAPVRGKRPRVAIHERARGVRMESDIGYVPSEDDRPIGSSGNIPTELTLSQQLLMKQYEEQVERMSKAECQDLALEIARQMMVKVCHVYVT